MVLLQALGYLAVAVAIPALTIHGLWRLIVGRARRWPGAPRGAVRAEGLGRLLTAGLMVTNFWTAVPIAEARTGWVDEDGDGILDGFSNVDWMDHVADSWGWTWLLFSFGVLVVAKLVSMVIDQRLAVADHAPDLVVEDAGSTA